MVIKKKIVLLGDSAVGKTSILRRILFDRFEGSYISTLGSKVATKELKIRGPNRTENLKLVIWDLIGSKGYHALHAMTFVGADGALLVSDMTREATLESLENYWVPSLFNIVEEVPLVFVCNKSDLEGEVEFEFEDLIHINERYNAGYDEILPSELSYSYSTSAKNGENVEVVFETLGHLVLCNEEPKDPVKELYGSLVATDIGRSVDITTAIGTLDSIIVDFCKGFEDSRIAMLILRQEMARAKINISCPTKEDILKFIRYLAEAENEFLDENMAQSNLERRLNWAYHISESRLRDYSKNAFETLRPTL